MQRKKNSSGLEIAARAARAGNSVVSVIAALLISAMLLYGGYSLWEQYQISYGAFTDDKLMKLKPAGDGSENPSLAELQKINSDVCAWLTIDDTHIDYPVVQGETNLEYVNKDVYGEFAFYGSVFLDCENSREFVDCYSLLYGHHMDNGGMFGDLTEFEDKNYFEEHKTGMLYLPDRTRKITIFACAEADATDGLIFNPKIQTEESMDEFLEYIKENSVQYREIGITDRDQIIGLSTCITAETNGRAIVFGRLEK